MTKVTWTITYIAIGLVATIAMLLFALSTADAQQSDNSPCVGTKPCPWIYNGNTIGTFTGTSRSQGQSITVAGWSIMEPYTLTINKTADCMLVVLEHTADKLVIGCRAGIGK
jgi:hypothetical protein